MARGRLGDSKQHRWTDKRLLQIINQGQANICKLTGIYRKEAYVSLANGTTRYLLPSDCMTVRRLEYRGESIPLYSRDDIDNGKQPSNTIAAIKDNLSMGLIDIYPSIEDLESDSIVIEGYISDDTFTFDSVYGVVTETGTPFQVDPAYGTIVDNDDVIMYEGSEPQTIWGDLVEAPDSHVNILDFPNGVNGITVDIDYGFSTNPELFGFITKSDVYKVVGQYGLITSVAPIDNTLKVYYEAVPTDLYDDSTMLVIPAMWEEAMLRYLVGTALQDDNDANNIQRGELELQKYTTEVLKARELASKDFSGGTKEKYHTRFRRV